MCVCDPLVQVKNRKEKRAAQGGREAIDDLSDQERKETGRRGHSGSQCARARH